MAARHLNVEAETALVVPILERPLQGGADSAVCVTKPEPIIPRPGEWMRTGGGDALGNSSSQKVL